MESLRRGTYPRKGSSQKLSRGDANYAEADRRIKPSRKRKQNVKGLRTERE